MLVYRLQALENAVICFLGMGRNAQLRVLDNSEIRCTSSGLHPRQANIVQECRYNVVIFVFCGHVSQVHGGLQQLDQQWPADAAFEAGSSTEDSDWAGSSENALVLHRCAQITFSKLNMGPACAFWGA